VTWPAALLWVLILAAALSRGPLILYLFSSTVIFGALSMAPAAVTGGLNLPAQTVCAAVLIVKVMLRSNNLSMALRHGLDIRKLGLLGFFMVYILATTLIYPRLFGGQVQLYSLNAAGSLTPLGPSSTNFTQTIYLLISSAMVFVFGMAGRSDIFRRHYMRSVLLGGVALVGSGILDLACNLAGKSSLLTPFHNATYNSLDTVSLAGTYRVVGLMPEASVFGQATCLTLSFLVFNFRYFEPRLRPTIVLPTILALAFMTFRSTSSTGYAGLIVLTAAALGWLLSGLVLVPIRTASTLRRVTYVITGVGALIVAVVLVGPYLVTKYHHLLDAVVLNKQTSSSYLERSRWTAAGLASFFATHGVGVGVGSVRTSSWFVNILASTGVVGVTLFGGFVLKLILPFGGVYARPSDRRFASTLALSLLPGAVMIGISGTTPDPGVWLMSIFGVIYSMRLKPQTVPLPPMGQRQFAVAGGDQAGLAAP
jgi:hypothetical protein